MIATSYSVTLPDADLAGPYTVQPNLWQIQGRLQTLLDRYCALSQLNEHLIDLPQQFQVLQRQTLQRQVAQCQGAQYQCTPSRPWKPIPWKGINASQIIGIEPWVFLAILAGAADTEEPIRGYTQASRQYLEWLYPPMAHFVGGTVDAQGRLLELGVWEQEERRHSPALQKLYTQLTGLKLTVVSHTPRPYSPTDTPRRDLYHHGLHRVATEYGAMCLYLWLMAHSTGPLQAVLGEILTDEINHLSKFLGFGLWAFPESSGPRVLQNLVTKALERFWTPTSPASLCHTLCRMTQVLHWDVWSSSNQMSFLWTFAIAFQKFHAWTQVLTPDYLDGLLGEPHGHSRPIHHE